MNHTYVVSQTEGNSLGVLERLAFVEQAVKVHMEGLARGGVHVDVLQVPVPQTDDVAHHAVDGGAADVGHPRHQPGLRV